MVRRKKPIIPDYVLEQVLADRVVRTMIEQNEGAKFWLRVMNEPRRPRGFSRRPCANLHSSSAAPFVGFRRLEKLLWVPLPKALGPEIRSDRPVLRSGLGGGYSLLRLPCRRPEAGLYDQCHRSAERQAQAGRSS